jgi:hypothetical protein
MRGISVALIVLLFGPGSLAAVAAEVDGGPPAIFEGEPIDLERGWEAASACLVHPGGVECFRSEAELDARESDLALDPLSTQAHSSGRTSAATCSTALRLYDGSYQTGDVLALSVRGSWINLSSYGFDNRTSSFRVGACAVELASGSWGSGSLYPRCTYAWCEEDVMASGWNNVISSAYLK